MFNAGLSAAFAHLGLNAGQPPFNAFLNRAAEFSALARSFAGGVHADLHDAGPAAGRGFEPPRAELLPVPRPARTSPSPHAVPAPAVSVPLLWTAAPAGHGPERHGELLSLLAELAARILKDIRLPALPRGGLSSGRGGGSERAGGGLSGKGPRAGKDKGFGPFGGKGKNSSFPRSCKGGFGRLSGGRISTGKTSRAGRRSSFGRNASTRGALSGSAELRDLLQRINVMANEGNGEAWKKAAPEPAHREKNAACETGRSTPLARERKSMEQRPFALPMLRNAARNAERALAPALTPAPGLLREARPGAHEAAPNAATVINIAASEFLSPVAAGEQPALGPLKTLEEWARNMQRRHM